MNQIDRDPSTWINIRTMRSNHSCYDLYRQVIMQDLRIKRQDLCKVLHCSHDCLLSPTMIPGSLLDETGSLRSGAELAN